MADPTLFAAPGAAAHGAAGGGVEITITLLIVVGFLAGLAWFARRMRGVNKYGAARIQMLAGMIPELFTANPTTPAAVKTRALPVIWTGAADFKAKAEALSKAAGAVAAAAQSGNVDATKAASRDVTAACTACHDTYRGPAAP